MRAYEKLAVLAILSLTSFIGADESPNSTARTPLSDNSKVDSAVKGESEKKDISQKKDADKKNGTETKSATPAPTESGKVSLLGGAGSLKVFAQFSAIGIASTTRPFPPGAPLFLTPRSATGAKESTFDIHARQTAFGAVFSGPEICGFTPGAYFLGFIQNDSLTTDAYGFLPFNAYGELKNDCWRIAGGLQPDVFNPAAPTVISLMKLYATGNTGSFRGQIRVERFFKPADDFAMTIQAALGEPVATVINGDGRVVEDNGWPNVEGRVVWGMGCERELCGGRRSRPLDVGVSGVIGQLRNSNPFVAPAVRSIVDVWGLGADLQWAPNQRFGGIAEFYVGQSLGEYNGAVGQSFRGGDFHAIRSSGGFGELYWYFSDKLHLHVGYALDAPVIADLAPTQLARNRTYYANLVCDVTRALQISGEIDYRKTDFIGFRDVDGVVFVTQMLWKF